MQNADLTQYEKNVLDRLGELIQSGKVSLNFIVENIKLIELFIEPKTIMDFKRCSGMSYPGIKKSKRFRKETFFNVKFVINND